MFHYIQCNYRQIKPNSQVIWQDNYETETSQKKTINWQTCLLERTQTNALLLT